MSEVDLLRMIQKLESQVNSLKSGWNFGAHGWIPACEVWTRTGANTFTLAGQGDWTGIYQKGTKLRYKQGGAWQYQYVVSSSYAAPTTTVTTTGGSDYSFAAGSITDNRYSYAALPQGFPNWFNYSCTWASSGAPQPAINNGTFVAQFRLNGPVARVHIYIGWGNGTTGGNGNYTWTLPIALVSFAYDVLGYGSFLRQGTGFYSAHLDNQAATTTIKAIRTTTEAVIGSATAAWANTDLFVLEFDYAWA